MIKINKSRAPQELSQYKRECAFSIDNGVVKLLDEYPHKDSLRSLLAEEQGFLCAYCMGRINLEHGKTKIEHFYPQR